MLSGEVQTTLAGALGIGAPELVAFVGAGGKSTALRRLAEELATPEGGVLATTTTAMFARQLTSLGPLILEDEADATLAERAGEALRGAGVVTLAKRRAPGGKVKGLAPAEVDDLWRSGVAGSIVLEADGSRGLPLKAFGAAEPQVPSSATTVVVLAGLDALGLPLDEDHVHRAGLLASALGVTVGARVTPDLFCAALTLQVARVREGTPAARVVVLLNKADSADLVDRGAGAGGHQLVGAGGRSPGTTLARPDRVVVASLERGTYLVVGGADS